MKYIFHVTVFIPVAKLPADTAYYFQPKRLLIRVFKVHGIHYSVQSRYLRAPMYYSLF